MTEKQKADMMRNELLAYCSKRDIAWFLLDEIKTFLRSLNSYKLEKLSSNKTLFKRFMFLLDDQNTKQLHYSLNDSYYMSQRWMQALSKKKKAETWLSQARMIQIASKVQAMFVFQAVEFCNGSMDRMKVIDFSKIRSSIMRKCQETR